MTVAELREWLKDKPGDMRVCIWDDDSPVETLGAVTQDFSGHWDIVPSEGDSIRVVVIE